LIFYLRKVQLNLTNFNVHYLINMEINFSHSIQLRVRYSETDQMGYCYYGNYAQYFEVGRVEALRQVGVNYKELEEDGVMLPVSELSILYKSPAHYDDLLTIHTKVTASIGTRLFFEYEIQNQNDQQICTGKTTLVFVSKKNMKPISPPAHFINLLSKV
jgi:acyl-CoA thioester hydrolase